MLGLKWNALGISEHNVEKTLEKKESQNGSNLAVFMLKSCKLKPNQLFCDLLLTSNIHAFVPALLSFVSDTVRIFLKRVQVQQSAVKRVNQDNFIQDTRATKMYNSLRPFFAGKVNVYVSITYAFVLLENRLESPLWQWSNFTMICKHAI